MSPKRSWWALAATLVLSAGGCGGSEGVTSTRPAASGQDPVNTERPAPAAGKEPVETEEAERNGARNADRVDPSQVEKERAAAAAGNAYAAYIDAINAEDGEALCDLLPPDALRDLKPPVKRGGCAASLAASIGYEDPRGYPVWQGTALTAIDSTSIGRDVATARLTATIVTNFADRAEPSIESDIAYLELVGGRWRLAKPSSAVYRAIGRPEPPPEVITPP